MERLDRFMARANAAYYAARDPYSDFATAPEISQVFGEIIGLWAAVAWQGMGSPAPVLLAEAGPGRGTLMADAMRAIGLAASEFGAALRLHLVESSPRLRAAQMARLPAASWHDRIEALPSGPLLLIANEFFDALPVRQFVRRGGGWAERFVVEGRVVEQAFPGSPLLSEGLAQDVSQGTVIEHSEAAIAIARHLGARLSRESGAALLLDYGAEAVAGGDSLQALRDGRRADPFACPGEADLTAHVDFAAIAAAARAAGAAVHGPVPQGLFLAQLGLFQRTDRLARTQSPARAGALLAAARRLAEPDHMGRLFKALALCHPAAPTPPGFEA